MKDVEANLSATASEDDDSQRVECLGSRWRTSTTRASRPLHVDRSCSGSVKAHQKHSLRVSAVFQYLREVQSRPRRQRDRYMRTVTVVSPIASVPGMAVE